MAISNSYVTDDQRVAILLVKSSEDLDLTKNGW